jgi:MFS family permease
LKSIYYIPAGIQAVQLGLTFWLEARAQPGVSGGAAAIPATSFAESDAGAAARGKTFLNLAWLANPFAYIAINTLVAVMPGVATRLGLSTMLAGFCGSVWCFARVAAFLGLWFWDGWHYRFRWLLAAYVALIVSFTGILLAPSLLLLVLAQLLFGLAIGLIYYSSLYYSMHGSDTQGEHGGIHEAAIGLGNFAGPAVGAASLFLAPSHANASALAVSALLILGLGGLLAIWGRGR